MSLCLDVPRAAFLSALSLAVGLTSQSQALAARDSLTDDQRRVLAANQPIAVEAIVLTDAGTQDPASLRALVVRRLGELGYQTTDSKSVAQDGLAVRAKCEQRKTWEGTTAVGGDNDQPDAPSRLWKGPACQLTYLLGGQKMKWQKEIRASFEDAAEAAKQSGAADPGAYAMVDLAKQLERYDFPVLLAAQWGHDDRLLRALESSETSQARKLLIITQLGEMLSDDALPRLKEALKDKDLSRQAAVAIGNIGREGIPVLVEILHNSSQPELQAAAAKGLGQVGGLHGDATVVPPLLQMLNAPGIPIEVQTEVAWALGKIPDKRSIEPLYALDRKLQAIRSEDPKHKKLKEAVFWSIKQCDTWDQFS
ncbi:MAG: HEAT repeat domain-containing protein [Nitrospiraceae bacterium]